MHAVSDVGCWRGVLLCVLVRVVFLMFVTFWCHPLPFPECLNSFTMLEHLSETEWYFCAHCKKRQPSSKQLSLRALPNVSLCASSHQAPTHNLILNHPCINLLTWFLYLMGKMTVYPLFFSCWNDFALAIVCAVFTLYYHWQNFDSIFSILVWHWRLLWC